MSEQSPDITSIRNYLSPLNRIQKGILGTILFGGSLWILFGPRSGETSLLMHAFILAGAFVAFGFGWSFLSQGLMGWSKQFDFDFEKNEVRQIGASILGRSRPYKVPFFSIADFNVREQEKAGAYGEKGMTQIELLDYDERPFIRAGMFETKAEADALVDRIRSAKASQPTP